jgi:hypothetical protein
MLALAALLVALAAAVLAVVCWPVTLVVGLFAALCFKAKTLPRRDDQLFRQLRLTPDFSAVLLGAVALLLAFAATVGFQGR